MHKLAVAVLFGVLSLVAHAQSQPQAFQLEKPVPCSSLKAIIEEVTGPKYQEEPFWNGVDSESKYIMTINKKTKSWTMIQYNNQGTACVIGTGTMAQLIFPNASDI